MIKFINENQCLEGPLSYAFKIIVD